MLEVINHTPFVAELHPCDDVHGRDYAVVIIKATYNINPLNSVLLLAEEQAALQHADEYYAEPGKSSIKYGSDLALMKAGTDVVVRGHAYAPSGKAATQINTTLTVDGRTKNMRIFGDRVWEKHLGRWEMSMPTPFERIPLIYENAFGGIDPSGAALTEGEDNVAECDPYNPCGKGFLAKKSRPVEGMPLPNIEDGSALISDPFDRPKPVGLGVIARDWQPRLAYAGTYDQQWQETRMPLLPLDFNHGFFNSAHPDLIFSPWLQGGEEIAATGLNAVGLLSFQLPLQQFFVTASMRQQQKTFPTQLDTVVIEPDENRVMLTWRVAIPCSRKFLYLESVTITEQP